MSYITFSVTVTKDPPLVRTIAEYHPPGETVAVPAPLTGGGSLVTVTENVMYDKVSLLI